MQQTFGIPHRKRKPDAAQYCQAEDLGTGYEWRNGERLVTPSRMCDHPARLKQVPSDITVVPHPGLLPRAGLDRLLTFSLPLPMEEG